MRSGYAPEEQIKHLLAALEPQNRLALEISLATGLRISDVLNLRTEALRASQRLTIREQKTGKTRRIRIPNDLRDEALRWGGKIYVFEGRLDYRRPRTRQAVFKDIKRIARVFKLPISSHSMRKIYAVEQYRRSGGDLQRVQRLLNHDNEAVTMIYALADQLGQRASPGARRPQAVSKRATPRGG
jgi:integrase